MGLLHAAMLAPIVPLSDALATTAAHESEIRSADGGSIMDGCVHLVLPHSSSARP